MDEKKPMVKVKYRKVTPRSGVAIAVVAGVLIVLGFLDALLFFDFSLIEVLILALALIVFYAIILFASLRPKVIRVVMKKAPTQNQTVVKEAEKPVTININNQSPSTKTATKKKTVKKKRR